jgi:DNA-binding MarR family transcriptional regulator
MKPVDRASGPLLLPLNQNLVHHFLRIVNGLNIRLAETIRVLNINVNQFRVLQILYEHDGLIISELRDQCVITQPVFSRVLQQVERRKLVKRVPDENDKRAYRVWLTQRGVATYEHAVPFARQILDDMCSALEPHEVKRLVDVIATIDHKVNGA